MYSSLKDEKWIGNQVVLCRGYRKFASGLRGCCSIAEMRLPGAEKKERFINECK